MAESREAPPSAMECAPMTERKGARGRVHRFLVPLLVLTLVGWSLVRIVPTGPAEGNSVGGTLWTTGEWRPTLRVATFNIHGGKDRLGHRDLSRTADCLRDLDLIGLNEVHGPSFLIDRDQAQVLGERLAMPWLFAATERQLGVDRFGNALLTTLPVAHWRRRPLPPTAGGSRRNMLRAQLRYQGKDLLVLITHLAPEEESSQLAAVAEEFLAMPEPALLVGDFNRTILSPQMRSLVETPGVQSHLTLERSRRDSRHRIDWILTRGFRWLRAGWRDNQASDHPCCWAELELSH